MDSLKRVEGARGVVGRWKRGDLSLEDRWSYRRGEEGFPTPCKEGSWEGPRRKIQDDGRSRKSGRKVVDLRSKEA